MDEALADPQLAARGLMHRFEEAEGVAGPFAVPVAAFGFAHGGPRVDAPPRPLGADTDAILAELGYDDAARAALRTHRRDLTKDTPMATFTFDHIHLRSPDIEATAAFYERVFGVTLTRSAAAHRLQPRRAADLRLADQRTDHRAMRPPRPIAGWSISAWR